MLVKLYFDIKLEDKRVEELEKRMDETGAVGGWAPMGE